MTCGCCGLRRASEEEWNKHEHLHRNEDGILVSRGCRAVGCKFYTERCWTMNDDECSLSNETEWKERAMRAEEALGLMGFY